MAGPVSLKREMAVCRRDGKLACILLEDGMPAELLEDTGPEDLHRHDVFLGRVRRVVTSLKCAFIDIGLEHDAMLPLHLAVTPVKEGQIRVVQIVKLTEAGKGCKVTGYLSLPGPYAVWKAHGPARARSKLRFYPEDRQQALFNRDLARLEALAAAIRQDSQAGPVPRRLACPGDAVQTALAAWTDPELMRIQAEGLEIFHRVDAIMQQQMPHHRNLLHVSVPGDGFSLMDVLGLADLDEQLSRRKMWLESGGFLVIERTEALTVIDVNSGRDTRGHSDRELRLRTNLQAASLIGRLVRLRNLDGMILVDFLRMPDEASRTAVQDALALSLSRDRGHNRMFGFTAMGLFEMIRTAF